METGILGVYNLCDDKSQMIMISWCFVLWSHSSLHEEQTSVLLNVCSRTNPWRTGNEAVKYFFTEVLAGGKKISLHIIYYSLTFSFPSQQQSCQLRSHWKIAAVFAVIIGY